MVLIPHIKFIEALVCAKISFDDILMELSNYYLDTDPRVVNIIVQTIHKNLPLSFTNQNPEPIGEDFIRAIHIEEMFCKYAKVSFPEVLLPTKGAFDLLQDPIMYRVVTSLAMAKGTDEDYDLIVNGKFNLQYSLEDIKLFLKYFFNIEDWTVLQKQNYTNRVADVLLSKFYKLALKGDKEHLVWKLGITPNKDFKSMLAEMAQDAFFNFKEQSRANPDSAQKWAALALKVSDKMDSINREESRTGRDLLEEIEFKIKTFSAKESTIRHIKDLDEL